MLTSIIILSLLMAALDISSPGLSKGPLDDVVLACATHLGPAITDLRFDRISNHRLRAPSSLVSYMLFYQVPRTGVVVNIVPML